MYRLDPIDYGRRVAVEKELAADLGGWLRRGWWCVTVTEDNCSLRILLAVLVCPLEWLTSRRCPSPRLAPAPRLPLPPAEAPKPNAVFDDSGNFLLYPSLLGIKVRWAVRCGAVRGVWWMSGAGGAWRGRGRMCLPAWSNGSSHCPAHSLPPTPAHC